MDPDPKIAATECEYFGPIQRETKTGISVIYRLEPNAGTASWKRFEHRYQIVSEDKMADKVTTILLSKDGPSVKRSHHIDGKGTTRDIESWFGNSPSVTATTMTYVDDKDVPCAERNERWNSEGLAGKSAEGLAYVSSLVNRGQWAVDTASSSFDDSKTVILALPASNEISGWPGVTRTPVLVLRCKEQKTEAYINAFMQATTRFGESGEDLGTSMRGRYDKDDAVHYLMSKSTDGQTFFFPNAVREIKSMVKHSSLVLEFTPFNSSPVEMRFDLKGLAEVLKPLREVCGW